MSLLTRQTDLPIETYKSPGMFVPLTPHPDAKAAISTEEHKKLVKNCALGIMVLGQNKQTIKKVDLNKVIYSKSRAQHHTLSKAVLQVSNHYLDKYMNMRLFELGDSKGYLLVNTNSIPNQCRKEFSQEECNELSAIFLVLMEIFSSSDETSTESQIKDILAILDLTEEEIKKYFDMLVKKLYISLVRDNTQQQEEKIYQWGPRAIAEVDPDSFMKSFLALAECGTDDDWPEQKRRIGMIKAIANRYRS